MTPQQRREFYGLLGDGIRTIRTYAKILRGCPPELDGGSFLPLIIEEFGDLLRLMEAWHRQIEKEIDDHAS